MHKDVVVVGAGISGIAAGYNLKKSCPNKSFSILEGRENIGGTWDLFKYPGIRSDSDMHTLGLDLNHGFMINQLLMDPQSWSIFMKQLKIMN